MKQKQDVLLAGCQIENEKAQKQYSRRSREQTREDEIFQQRLDDKRCQVRVFDAFYNLACFIKKLDKNIASYSPAGGIWQNDELLAMYVASFSLVASQFLTRI